MTDVSLLAARAASGMKFAVRAWDSLTYGAVDFGIISGLHEDLITHWVDVIRYLFVGFEYVKWELAYGRCEHVVSYLVAILVTILRKSCLLFSSLSKVDKRM